MSDRRTDPRFLLEEQYGTTDNLRARIAVHELFSTSPVRWPDWVFDGYAFGAEADILEVGCGDGSIWRQNLDRIPAGWHLTLTDFSPGMVDAARAGVGGRANYSVVDVQELPFDHEAFDAVIANHILFHVEDRARALAEIKRVLRPAGVLVGTTIGREHLREMRELLDGLENVIWSGSRERFGLETARVQLERFFTGVEIEPFPDNLEVTDPEPFVAFVRSLGTPGIGEPELAAIRAQVAEEIGREGSFHVTKAAGRFRCRKP